MPEYYKNTKLENTPPDEKRLFTLALDDIDPLVGVEIGVLNGENCRHLLNVTDHLYLHGIDPLIPDSMAHNLIGTKTAIDKNTAGFEGRFEFIHDYSFHVVDRFENESLDFVFIDGSHFYDDVEKDYKLYFPKVKKGGLIFIHDSRMNRGGANFHVGPSQLVDYIVKFDREVDLIGEAFSLTCFKKS